MQLGMMSLMIPWPYFSLVRQHVLVERISTINSYSLKKPKWTKLLTARHFSIHVALPQAEAIRPPNHSASWASKWVVVLRDMTEPERGEGLTGFQEGSIELQGKGFPRFLQALKLASWPLWEKSFGIKVDSSLLPFDGIVIYHLSATDLISK